MNATATDPRWPWRFLTKVGHGKRWAYTWDAVDRLSAVAESDTLVAQYAYDGFDRRIAHWNNAPCSGERTVWDGDQLGFVADCYGNLAEEYGWYPGSEQPLGVHYASGKKGVFLTDPQLGASLLGVADTNGLAASPVLKAYNTTAWGESPADTGLMVRLRLAGQQYDPATGLYYMRARFYDPALGKFLSEDPIGIEGGLNLYAYANNDPINNADPTGLDTECGPQLYKYTWRWVDGPDAGEISRYTYGYEWECHDVPSGTIGFGGESGGVAVSGKPRCETFSKDPVVRQAMDQVYNASITNGRGPGGFYNEYGVWVTGSATTGGTGIGPLIPGNPFSVAPGAKPDNAYVFVHAHSNTGRRAPGVDWAPGLSGDFGKGTFDMGVAKSYQTNIIAVTQTAFYAADENGNKTPTCRR